jgi:glycosyltransferase involved in cell wall biosynthesis
MPRRLAIYHPAGQMTLKSDPFGKDVANLALFRALARYGGYEGLHVLTNRPVTVPELEAGLFDGFTGPPVTTSLVVAQDGPARAGTLVRGQPGLSELAWMRRCAVGDHAYSLIGLIHPIAPPVMREQIAANAIAPVADWDAVVCTSPAVRDAVTNMLDNWNDYLQQRFAGNQRPRPRLPVIPLGVDGATFAGLADRPEARARMRARLGLAADDVLIIWVGRFSFFEKAFPQPMFRAVEEAAATTDARVHFAMAGWFPNPDVHRRQYEQAVQAYAPNTPIHFLDGNDQTVVGELWAAGDIFLSLVDNIQETFGLTPVEAMAAGLPVVVSDWDGYRFTVRDGVEGFLVPTLGGPAGPIGDLIVARHAAQLDTYQAYVGAIAQHTAVHVGCAAKALAELIKSSDLRHRMGTAGRRRVRDALDWSVVAQQYGRLADELGELRNATAELKPVNRAHPVKGDPFADFAGFPTHQLTLRSRLRIRAGASVFDLERAAKVDLDRGFAGWRGNLDEAAVVLKRLADGASLSVEQLLAYFPKDRHLAVQMSLVWLAKLGILDWLEDDLKVVRFY